MIPVCKYIVEYRVLKALAIFASKDNTRYVLNGVAIESDETHKFIVSTDGRRLGVIRTETTDQEEGAREVLTIPASLIKRVPKPKHDFVTITSDGSGVIAITCDDSSVTGKAINGSYPDWRKAIAHSATANPSRLALNSEILRGFLDVTKILSRTNYGIAIEQVEDSRLGVNGFYDTAFCIRIDGVPEFFGILMPMGPWDQIKSFTPDWLKPTKSA